MKKFLIIALAAVLLITGGMFAYTFTTATATIGVTAIQSDFATVTANATDVAALAPTVFGKYNGTWGTGYLFSVSPATGYTGDLVIRVYLVNTGALIRYYEHLNMTLKYVISTNVSADEQGIEQVLNLSNSEVLFTWASGNGTSPFYVQLTGGGYRLHPLKTLTGGSYQPQVWCEVIQR